MDEAALADQEREGGMAKGEAGTAGVGAASLCESAQPESIRVHRRYLLK
jgi:hypothetical protein